MFDVCDQRNYSPGLTTGFNIPIWRGKPLMYRFTCLVCGWKTTARRQQQNKKKKSDTHGFQSCHQLHVSSLKHRAWWANMKCSLCQIKVKRAGSEFMHNVWRGFRYVGGEPNQAFSEPLKILFTCSTNIYHCCDQKLGFLARREAHK